MGEEQRFQIRADEFFVAQGVLALEPLPACNGADFLVRVYEVVFLDIEQTNMSPADQSSG